MVIKGTMREVLNILENMTEEEFKAKLESEVMRRWFIWKQ